MKRTIILLPKTIAKEGYVFHIYNSDMCVNCRLYNVCISKLIIGKKYKVSKVMKKIINEFRCLLTDVPLVPVYVEPQPSMIAVNSQEAIEGIIIRYHRKYDCKQKNCIYKNYCYPNDIKINEKLRIIDVHKKINCPLKFPLYLVSVLPP